MKLSGAAAVGYFGKPDPASTGILIYGQDAMRVALRRQEVILALIGLYIGFFVAPTDYQQGEAYRIIFIHVPAAWMAMFAYLVMAGWCAASLIWNTRMSAMMAQAIAPTGAIT